MAKCQKCGSTNKAGAVKCYRCGKLLHASNDPVGPNDESGTLDAQERLGDPNATVTGDAITLDDPKLVSDTAATIRIDEVEEPDNLAETLSTLIDPDVPLSSDDNKTVRLPDDVQPGEDSGFMSTLDSEPSSNNPLLNRKPSGTEIDLESSRIIGSAGSSGASGTDKLNKVWEAAIGSSSKQLGQSLRFERAEASDSVFARVASRRIADANSEGAEDADYTIQDKIAEGGMGIIFSAMQNTVKRIVAVKCIKSEKQRENSARKQFFYEAEITAGLDHPNIPPIYELGVAGDGLLFYSMKLIQGTAWHKLLRQRSREENLEIFNKVADAIAFAHSRNIIHRDLKPDNVMIGAFGEVYVVDWGMGVNLDQSKSIGFGGTPDFMAPEMAKDRRKEIGKHSDIYLLGAVLFQVLTGKPPHLGKNPRQRLIAAMENQIAETDSDDPLLEIAYKAMETEPIDRYETVEKMQDAIREIEQHAESITLANRSKELIATAVARKDYDSFNRSIFGFRDAIELWQHNQVAKAGLAEARLAYGQTAFDKGDYDLAVQTLDPKVREEAALLEKARKAKIVASQREKRLKTLRKVFLTSVTVFSILLTCVAAFAWNQMGIAQRNETDAKNQKEIAEEKKKEAENALIKEKEALTAEKAAKEAEKEAKSLAQQETQRAIKETERAIAEEQKAIAAKKQEEIAKQEAIAAEKIARQKNAQNQLGKELAGTGLAKLKVERFDVQETAKLLSKVEAARKDGDVFMGKAPQLDTWAVKRVNLLANADLPKQSLDGHVDAVDFAIGKNLGVAGTDNGKLHLVRQEGAKLVIVRSELVDGAVQSVAISPMADEALITLRSNAGSKVLVWQLQGKESPQTVRVFENRPFQQVAYSPDGKRIVIGINSGIWTWSRTPNWHRNLNAEEIDIIRQAGGQLRQLQWLDDSTVLASSIHAGQFKMYRLDLNGDTAKSQVIEFPESIRKGLSVAQHMGGNRFVVGRDDGLMMIGELNLNAASASASRFEVLPPKHASEVSQIVPHGQNQFVSISRNESVAHLWKIDSKGDVQYDTYLSGVPSGNASINLSRVAFIDGEQLVGIDEGGTAVVWNVDRQRQRQQLTRISDHGPESYVNPVIGVFDRGDNSVLTVDNQGIVDLWNLRTGRTTKLQDSVIGSHSANSGNHRYSYRGHTPGAELSDSVVHMDSGVIVTAASLRRAQMHYLDDPRATGEICVWHQPTGDMLHRWTFRSDDSIDPRISLLGNGKQILLALDKSTRIFGLDGRELQRLDKVAIRFAVPNPKNPALIAAVIPSGRTWLLDTNQPGWNIPSEEYYREDADGNPIQAVWSEDGSRLFQLYNNGRLLVFELAGNRLVQATGNDDATKAWKANFSNYVVTRHLNLDLDTTQLDNGSDRLFINVRIPSAQKESSQTIVDVSRGKFEIKTIASDRSQGHPWLNVHNRDKPFDDRIHENFDLNPASRDTILHRVRSGNQTFVSTRSGSVLELSNNSNHLTSFGRPRVLSVAYDRAGKSLITLYDGGLMDRLVIGDDQTARRSVMPFTGLGFQSISASPDGTQLILRSDSGDKLKRVNLSDGKLQQEYANVAAFCWHPNRNAALVIAHDDGRIEMAEANGTLEVGRDRIQTGAKIVSISVYKEVWENKNQKPVEYLLVQTEDAADGYLRFVPLAVEQNAEAQADAKSDKNSILERSIGKGALVATSPTDSIFLVGGRTGSLNVWTASPTWSTAEVVFDLVGHTSELTALTFSQDGKTVLSADKNSRLLGWMSEDGTVSP